MELEITALAAGGDGLGHADDGRVVFVPFTAPGDRVRVRVHEERGRFLRARVETLHAPGPGRVAPRCEVFGSCGGCSWQHLAYPTQLEAKVTIVRDALERVARVSPPVVEITPSPATYGYRARTRVQRRGHQVGYRQRRSHELCAVKRCPVLHAPVEQELQRIAAGGEAAGGEWEIAAGTGPPRAVALALSGSGDPIELRVGDDPLRVSTGVFFQANVGLHAALHEAVLDRAGHGTLALELCAGAGFFTLELARRFGHLIAVEAHEAAALDLRHNLDRAGLTNITVVAKGLERALLQPPVVGVRPDLVLLDPPRSGVGPDSVRAIAALGVPRIVYLSCDPATLARDLAGFVREGYELASVRAFDLFPQTAHIEVLACLERAGAP